MRVASGCVLSVPVCMLKMRRLVLASGRGNSIFLSMRPGLMSAGSSVSMRLVAMITWRHIYSTAYAGQRRRPRSCLEAGSHVKRAGKRAGKQTISAVAAVQHGLLRQNHHCRTASQHAPQHDLRVYEQCKLQCTACKTEHNNHITLSTPVCSRSSHSCWLW